MNREQYVKIIERELHNLNKRIDMKILQGIEYRKEAREHKMLQKKMIQHSKKSFFSRFVTAVPQFLIFF
jgi:glutamate mutase epsilon subunit